MLEQDTIQTQTMYNKYRFGDFSYGSKRDKFDTLLFKFLSRVGKNQLIGDIGCGTGHWMENYVQSGIPKENIVGVDIAPDNVENLKKKGFNAVCGNILNLTFRDNFFDFTVCNGVLHHTRDPYKAFKQLVRVTKSGGYIYLNVYNMWHPYFYLAHKTTFPARWLYWKGNKKVADILYLIFKIIYLPVVHLIFKEEADDKTAKIFFMDQVMTPYAHLFSRSKLEKYADGLNCTLVEVAYNRYFLMLAVIIKVN